MPPRSNKTRELHSPVRIASCNVMSWNCTCARSRIVPRRRRICKALVAQPDGRILDLRSHGLIVGQGRFRWIGHAGSRAADQRQANRPATASDQCSYLVHDHSCLHPRPASGCPGGTNIKIGFVCVIMLFDKTSQLYLTHLPRVSRIAGIHGKVAPLRPVRLSNFAQLVRRCKAILTKNASDVATRFLAYALNRPGESLLHISLKRKRRKIPPIPFLAHQACVRGIRLCSSHRLLASANGTTFCGAVY